MSWQKTLQLDVFFVRCRFFKKREYVENRKKGEFHKDKKWKKEQKKNLEYQIDSKNTKTHRKPDKDWDQIKSKSAEPLAQRKSNSGFSGYEIFPRMEEGFNQRVHWKIVWDKDEYVR